MGGTMKILQYTVETLIIVYSLALVFTGRADALDWLFLILCAGELLIEMLSRRFQDKSSGTE